MISKQEKKLKQKIYMQKEETEILEEEIDE
jgi:hypothetical protein